MPPKVVESSVVRCPHCGRNNRVPKAGAGAPRCGECREPLPWVVDARDDDFAEVAEAARIPVVVDFWASWCGPCRMVSPALQQVATELAGRIKLVKVNIDEAPETSRRFGVQAVPTLAVLRLGRVVVQRAGAAPAPVLREWVRDALAG
ncbi:thioredoxin [Microbispora siamensis]|uniref:Thioredoxin n=1 Tax=Microbispora siamensis TaxID=564413 RepID=A0ABQ4GXJ7_9ACTN|nr:thioredoxin [Microbispora siamensis]GIH66044.1 thiol reductase thioredoxin [Microbispora siamensis]